MKHHDESKLFKRRQGSPIACSRWIAPWERHADGKIELGATIELMSATNPVVRIHAIVQRYAHGRITARILGFLMCNEAHHNGMTYGDTIAWDESYVISCQCE